jgi:hypothetical protein
LHVALTDLLPELEVEPGLTDALGLPPNTPSAHVQLVQRLISTSDSGTPA